MQALNQNVNQLSISCPNLPLTVYREVAAHLQQVEHVTITLLPQLTPTFDYYQSQVGGLTIHFEDGTSASHRARVEQILAYYADRFGDWQPYLV